MTELNEFFNEPLTDIMITDFSQGLTDIHFAKAHNPTHINAGATLMDLICYVFNNNLTAISTLLQDWDDGDEFAVGLANALINGVKKKELCCDCVKSGVIDMAGDGYNT